MCLFSFEDWNQLKKRGKKKENKTARARAFAIDSWVLRDDISCANCEWKGERICMRS